MKSRILLLSMLNLLVSATPQAEVALDGTLGPKANLAGPNYAIGAELGAQRGGNLFHSFAQFNLNTGDSATFSGPNNVINIISRVTGGTSSQIDGAIRSTIPNADLYLINPAGLLFGPNATLDVPGSFHASTADTLRFQDGNQFNARTPAASVLTVAPIQSFGFLTNTPAPLTVEGNTNLTASPGKTFSLVGGDLKINQSVVTAPGGHINLASVASPGEVTPLPEDLTLSATQQPGNINIQESIVTVSGGGSNAGIYIRGGQFTLTNASVQANTRTEQNAGQINVQVNTLTAPGGRFISNVLGTGTGQGGKIILKVQGVTEFTGENKNGDASGIISAAGKDAKGKAGDIELTTGSLTLQGGANINGTTSGTSQGGNITIRVTDAINLAGIGSKKQGSSIAANTRLPDNGGRGGIIVLEAKNLHLSDGALIATNSLGTGEGGQISIKVAATANLAGEDQRGVVSSILATAAGAGNGGTIILIADQLTLRNGANIRADSGGSGKGGNINIEVSNLVSLAGSDSKGYGSLISANANGRKEGAGSGGTIVLAAGRLQLTEGAQIGTSTFGLGQGGKVEVKVTDEVNLSGQDQTEKHFSSGLFTTSQGDTPQAGQGGTIILLTGNLVVKDKGSIDAGTYGPARGGDVSIQTRGSVNITNGGTITAHSSTTGDAGQITLKVGDTLNMRNGSIQTSAKNADGGNLVITAPNYVYVIGSQVTTSVSEEFGGGGNIVVAPKFVVLDGSQVFAKAKKGRGGNINIVTTGVYNFTKEAIGKVINASSEMGVDGVVTITTPEGSAVEGLIALPAGLINVSGLMKTPCGQRDTSSSFVVMEREGTPLARNDLIPSGPRFAKVGATPSRPTMTPKKVVSATTTKTDTTQKSYPTVVLMAECRHKQEEEKDMNGKVVQKPN